MFSHPGSKSEMSDSDSICWAIRTKIRTRDHHIWWCGTALWACVLVGGMLAAQWAIGVPVLCSQWGLPWSEVKLAGRVGSILNRNGLLLMVAARGQRSLHSAWGDFQQAHRVKLGSARTPTHLNLEGGTRRRVRKVNSYRNSFRSFTQWRWYNSLTVNTHWGVLVCWFYRNLLRLVSQNGSLFGRKIFESSRIRSSVLMLPPAWVHPRKQPCTRAQLKQPT